MVTAEERVTEKSYRVLVVIQVPTKSFQRAGLVMVEKDQFCLVDPPGVPALREEEADRSCGPFRATEHWLQENLRAILCNLSIPFLQLLKAFTGC